LEVNALKRLLAAVNIHQLEPAKLVIVNSIFLMGSASHLWPNSILAAHLGFLAQAELAQFLAVKANTISVVLLVKMDSGFSLTALVRLEELKDALDMHLMVHAQPAKDHSSLKLQVSAFHLDAQK